MCMHMCVRFTYFIILPFKEGGKGKGGVKTYIKDLTWTNSVFVLSAYGISFLTASKCKERIYSFKGALSGLRQVLATKSP